MGRRRPERHDARGATWERLAAQTAYVAKPEDGTFSGMASVFGSVAVGARGPTRFQHGAFAETIGETQGRIPLLWQHDTARPVGVISKLAETEEGLELRGKITKNAFGGDVIALMRDGAITGLSIGFDALEAGYEKQGEGRVRVVSKARLHEVSLVTFPADREARVRTVHEAGLDLAQFLTAEANWSGDEVARLERALDAVELDLHEGRMFSGDNVKKLRDVWAMMTDLLGRGDAAFLKEAVAALQKVEEKPPTPEYPAEAAAKRRNEIQAAVRRAEIDATLLGAAC